MSLYAIADLHLSLNGEKPMDVFRGWQNYVQRLEDNWTRVVGEQDTVLIAGDISWAMKLEDAVLDFQFLHRLPGNKILLKGNHDYWWSTRNKIDHFLEEQGFPICGCCTTARIWWKGKPCAEHGAGFTTPKQRRTKNCGA